VRAGQVGLAITNSMPLLAPWGGTTKLLGNQAYAIGCPAGRYPPLLLDTSNSATSWGYVRLAHERGEPLDPGLAFDRDGQPTTDPAAALEGLLAPAGGHKGFGLALMWEILTGVLGGLAFGPNVGGLEDVTRTQEVSHFLLALDPAAYLPLDQFTARVDSLIEQIGNVPPVPGVERPYAPGEQGFARAAARERDGIPLSARRQSELAAIAKRVGVDPPFATDGA
jgi:LDH2 family malate/lactate/ureidoglycolate dehydrogenase